MGCPADGEREVVGNSLLTARILHLAHAHPSVPCVSFYFRQESNPVATDHRQYGIRYSVLHTSELSHRYGGRGAVASGQWFFHQT